MPDHRELSNFIWSIADLLRGPYRPPQYERVMLPLTVLRRFDCVLAGTQTAVLAEHEKRKGKLEGEALDKVLNRASKQRFHNHSPLTFEALRGDPDHIDKHLTAYINGFSANVRRIFDYFEFGNEIEKMREENILFLVVRKFCEIDLYPERVDNLQMGLLFEDLIRRFNEAANETAGDHFTPREVIRLMVHLLFLDDDELLATPGAVRKLLDPACGTGGMLAEAQNYLREHHAEARLYVYGQDYNKRAFAIAASDMLIKQVDHNGTGENIRFGDSLIGDQFSGERFDYLLANPPFGVDWKKQQREIEQEQRKQGFAGRFGAGLPRVNDGSLLFLQHMVSKFEPFLPAEKKHGSRLAIVFNGSPLFTGGAGSGESDIRKWIIENDWLEAIVALPEQMFYNTGIGTYIWIVTNRKAPERRGKIQLLDAREIYLPMRRSLGDKRRKIGDPRDGEPDQIGDLVRAYGTPGEWRLAEWLEKTAQREEKRAGLRVLAPGEEPGAPPAGIAGKAGLRCDVRVVSRVFDNAEFGYTRVTVERPLRLRYEDSDEAAAYFLEDYPGEHEALRIVREAARPMSSGDWSMLWCEAESRLQEAGHKWGAGPRKLFRTVFTHTDPTAEPVWTKVTVDDSRGDFDHVRARHEGAFFQEALQYWFRFEPDTALRDFENVPLTEDIDAYFAREVLPHVPDAWMDRTKDKVGYEINFNRHFYRYTPPRPFAEIDREIKAAEDEFMRMLREVTA